MVYHSGTGLPAPSDSDPVAVYAQIVRTLVDELDERANHHARVTQPAAQTLTNNTATLLTFGAEDFDPKGMHSTSVNPGRLTAGMPGRYRIAAGAGFVVDSNGWRYLSLRKNGTQVAFTRVPAAAGAATGLYISTLVDADETDYFEVYAQQTSGGDLDTISGSLTYLEAHYIGG